MATFSPTSISRLDTCHPAIQLVMYAAIARYDFTVLEGYRNEDEQNAAFDAGYSKVKYPNSKHNSLPAKAIDIAPYPVDWDDRDRFKDMACVVLEEASKLGIGLVWGGNWKTFKDYPHFELAEADDAG